MSWVTFTLGFATGLIVSPAIIDLFDALLARFYQRG